MILEQFPRCRGRGETAEQSLMLEIDDARSTRPVDMTMGPVAPVSAFVVNVDADATALDHLDHNRTVLPGLDIVKDAKRSRRDMTSRLRLLEAVAQDVHVLQG